METIISLYALWFLFMHHGIFVLLHQCRIVLLLLLLLESHLVYSLPKQSEKCEPNLFFKRRVKFSQPVENFITIGRKWKDCRCRNWTGYEKLKIDKFSKDNVSKNNQSKTKFIIELDDDIVPRKILIQLKTGLTISIEDREFKLHSIMDQFKSE